ncbi:MAG: ABC transporter ATP-binding protein [Alphaproteobacteria bacterium]|nr:ABC transporter ATP-binding protein [Alphaproteobacteria bacterium]MBU0834283.1 ABC transporter ATP-binding protein [Alphaproteobacteria bacterium]MBU1765542.1 ABC transporter ATP-binding protein [Alphaproteobacteria bacterium]
MRSVDRPAPTDRTVLRLEAVTKSFGGGTEIETEVLHGIDLVLQEGEFCALIGPSGSGKSTLLNIIGLLDRPTSGRMQIEGKDTAGLSDAAQTSLRGHSIGFVFQYHHLISAFTAVENVMMPMLLDKGWPSQAIREQAGILLDKVGLAPFKNSPANRMSGGQQQRVAIARALAMNPALVLADEPTGNLDSQSADEVFAMMRDVNRREKTTFLIVTHNLELARRTDRIIEIVDGIIVTTKPEAKTSAVSVVAERATDSNA